MSSMAPLAIWFSLVLARVGTGVAVMPLLILNSTKLAPVG